MRALYGSDCVMAPRRSKSGSRKITGYVCSLAQFGSQATRFSSGRLILKLVLVIMTSAAQQISFGVNYLELLGWYRVYAQHFILHKLPTGV